MLANPLIVQYFPSCHTTGGRAYQDAGPNGLPCPSHEGTVLQPILFGVLFWTGQEFICLKIIKYVTRLYDFDVFYLTPLVLAV